MEVIKPSQISSGRHHLLFWPWLWEGVRDLQARMHMNHSSTGRCTAPLRCEELGVLNTPSGHRTITTTQTTSDGESPEVTTDGLSCCLPWSQRAWMAFWHCSVSLFGWKESGQLKPYVSWVTWWCRGKWGCVLYCIYQTAWGCDGITGRPACSSSDLSQATNERHSTSFPAELTQRFGHLHHWQGRQVWSVALSLISDWERRTFAITLP